MSVRISYKNQFFFGILFLLILLSVIEIIVRIYEYNKENECSLIDKDAFGNIDSAFLKKICVEYKQIKYEGRNGILLWNPDQHLSHININSQGFRGHEISKSNDDSYRIIMIGGSTTFGWGSFSDEATIPAVLEKKFENITLDTKIEVINAGMIGATSTAESIYIKNVLLEYKPDLFIVYDGWNDVSVGHLDENVVKEKENKIFRFSDLKFYRTPFAIYQILFNPRNTPIIIPEQFSEDIITKWKNNWIDVCNLGKTRNFKTIVVVQPMVGSGNRLLSDDESKIMTPYQKYLLKGLAALTWRLPELSNNCSLTIDLRNVFDEQDKDVFFDAGHTTDYGNEIISQKLFELSLPLIKQDIESKTR